MIFSFVLVGCYDYFAFGFTIRNRNAYKVKRAQGQTRLRSNVLKVKRAQGQTRPRSNVLKVKRGYCLFHLTICRQEKYIIATYEITSSVFLIRNLVAIVNKSVEVFWFVVHTIYRSSCIIYTQSL